jgi:hypothetical protein
MKEVSSLFQNKRNLLGMALLGVLVFSTYQIQESSGRLKKVTTFESGVQTCFTRVNQTYTAKLLADSTSQYLTQNFEALTEECFAESLMNVDENFKIELTSVSKKLSNLASNVHWFHEELLAPTGGNALSKGEGKDIGSRFEKIENTKDEVLDSTDSFKTTISNQLNNSKNIFYISATLLIVVMLLEYLANTKRKISNNAREIEANNELLDNGGVESVKVGEIVRLALEQNELHNCAKLFNNYHVHNVFEKTLRSKNKNTLENLVTPVTHSIDGKLSSDLATKIDNIWNDDELGLSADTVEELNLKVLNLDYYSTRVVDMLAEKMFSLGVQIDINIAENIFVKGREEDLEQVLYHAFSFAINKAYKGSANKEVTISALKLGDVVAFDINASGEGFDNEILRSRVGLNSESKVLDLDLQICQSLLEECESKMQIDNRIDQTGNIIGSRIKMIFKAGQFESNEKANLNKLVALKVGTKKDILEQISKNN